MDYIIITAHPYWPVILGATYTSKYSKLTYISDTNIPNFLQTTSSFCSILAPSRPTVPKFSTLFIVYNECTNILSNSSLDFLEMTMLTFNLQQSSKVLPFVGLIFSQTKYKIIQKYKSKLYRLKCFHNLHTLIAN